MLRAVLIVIVVIAAILEASPLLTAAQPAQTSQQPPASSEKAARTPAQKKIDSQLLQEIYRLRGSAAQKRVPSATTGVKIDEKQRALVDVRADVTPELQKKVRSLKGTIVSTSPQYRTIIAWIPLLKLERLAEDRRVSAISPQTEPVMHR